MYSGFYECYFLFSFQYLQTDFFSNTFTADITPIILAGHIDNYEIIKMLLDRGYRIPKPHDLTCHCDDCLKGSTEDVLGHSRARINAYRALASPSLIALSSKDPILTAFELSWELRNLSEMENEFRTEYEELGITCQDFAVDLLDQIRGSKELEIILNHDCRSPDQNEEKELKKLNRLKLAIKYKQKKVSFLGFCEFKFVLRYNILFCIISYEYILYNYISFHII